jgi:hypothetical protein
MVITLAGQTMAHFPHPTHRISSTSAITPLKIEIALVGQTFTQVPQATHCFDIQAIRFAFIIHLSLL